MKKKKTTQVWAAFRTHDDYGSFTPETDLIGVFSTEALAEAAADGKGWYGGMGHVEERVAVIDGDSLYLCVTPQRLTLDKEVGDLDEKIFQSIMNKLTPKELEVLKKRYES